MDTEAPQAQRHALELVLIEPVPDAQIDQLLTEEKLIGDDA